MQIEYLSAWPIVLIKTKELIFHNPKARTCHSNLPDLLNIERVTSAKVLGIYIYTK